MAITVQPFVLRDVSLTLEPASGGTPQEYQCQLSAATLTPSSTGGTGNTLETFCDTYSDAGSNATWTLDLAGFQQYTDAADLALLLYNSEGEVYDFVLTPMGGTISATNPGFSGQVTLVPTQIGGTANQWATFSVSLPLVSKATVLSTPPA